MFAGEEEMILNVLTFIVNKKINESFSQFL